MTQEVNDKELRFYSGAVELEEQREDGKRYLKYYAVLFNQISRNMGGWYERILPEAFDKADVTEWVAKKNHDMNLILGASYAGTASYTKDSTGILCRILVGDTTTWLDTIKEVERGELRGASFEFSLAQGGARWITEKRGDINVEVREVVNIGKLWDLSPVVRPAYPGTMDKGVSVAKREYEQYLSAKEQRTEDETESPIADIDLVTMELEIV